MVVSYSSNILPVDRPSATSVLDTSMSVRVLSVSESLPFVALVSEESLERARLFLFDRGLGISFLNFVK
jgi:hypothetical protein